MTTDLHLVKVSPQLLLGSVNFEILLWWTTPIPTISISMHLHLRTLRFCLAEVEKYLNHPESIFLQNGLPFLHFHPKKQKKHPKIVSQKNPKIFLAKFPPGLTQPGRSHLPKGGAG